MAYSRWTHVFILETALSWLTPSPGASWLPAPLSHLHPPCSTKSTCAFQQQEGLLDILKSVMPSRQLELICLAGWSVGFGCHIFI